MSDVRFQGISIGTYARALVKPFIKSNNFYTDFDSLIVAIKIAKELIFKNIILSKK